MTHAKRARRKESEQMIISDLQLFADGAAAESGAESAAENRLEENSGENAAENTAADAGDGAAGGADPDAGGHKDTETHVTSNTLEARRREFDRLISGEYKNEFQERFQSIFNERFRDYKGMSEKLEAQQPIIDMLMQRYGIEGNDPKKLFEAFESDDEYWEEAAEREGMRVEQYRELARLRAENERMREAQESAASQNYVNQQLNEWFMQGESLKSVYPNFDFRTEIANRDFTGLLKAGIPMQKAYELMHMEEIMDNARQQTEKKVVDSIRSKAARPGENGLSAPNGFVLKKDVASLTKDERRELARRAARGEIIKF